MRSHFCSINIRISQNAISAIKIARYIPANHNGSGFTKVVNTINSVNTDIRISLEVPISRIRHIYSITVSASVFFIFTVLPLSEAYLPNYIIIYRTSVQYCSECINPHRYVSAPVGSPLRSYIRYRCRIKRHDIPFHKFIRKSAHKICSHSFPTVFSCNINADLPKRIYRSL